MNNKKRKAVRINKRLYYNMAFAILIISFLVFIFHINNDIIIISNTKSFFGYDYCEIAFDVQNSSPQPVQCILLIKVIEATSRYDGSNDLLGNKEITFMIYGNEKKTIKERFDILLTKQQKRVTVIIKKVTKI